jgi:hypothetical protein
MAFIIEDRNFPIGPTKTIQADTLYDLMLALQQLHSESFPLNISYHGWDDGSIIGHISKPHLHITCNKED